MRFHPHIFGIPLVFACICSTSALAQDDFYSSLHATRSGKQFWYGAENGGFESFTQIPIDSLGCIGCHGPSDADGNPYEGTYAPGCVDCHKTSDWSVEQSQCYSCHGRQKTEAFALGYSDVHRTAGMDCWDCHGFGDLHGDETPYESMLEPLAIGPEARCERCHQMEYVEGHDEYDPHQGALHCDSCHVQSVVSCYNCHFESLVIGHQKRAKQPIHDFVILVNRDEDGKVHPATFQSLTYDGIGFAAIAPYTAHTITREGRQCAECHVNQGGTNEAIEQYNATGEIRFAQWDEDSSTLSWMHGVVPLPYDYADTFKMDFITFDGDPHAPPGSDNANWSSIGKDTWDGQHLLFATPLTPRQMERLGFDVTSTCPTDINEDGVVDFADLLNLLAAWGSCTDCPEDVDGDGIVGFGDLLEVLGTWGNCR